MTMGDRHGDPSRLRARLPAGAAARVPNTAVGAPRTAGGHAGGHAGAHRADPEGRSAWRLVTLSLLMLFLELALIRWTAANDMYLATVTNFVLLATFLGIGLGFLLAGAKADLLRAVPAALLALVGFVLLFPVRMVALAGPHELEGIAGHHPLPEWLSLTGIFVLSAAVMAGIGQAMARSFPQFRPLEAYRLDIAGSIAGIALFSLLSFVGLPPIAWGAVAAVALALVLRRRRWWQWGALAILVGLLLAESMSPHDSWSPYYKITAVPPPHTRHTLVVSGDNVPYQTLYPVPVLRRIERFYFFPYEHVAPRARSSVLVIGAGTGNDVAVALAEHARRVDAVEIDPVLVALGRRYNPAYSSPLVHLHVDDGRAFLEESSRRYSLILYALPDSLTALSGQAAPVGLENFLLTRQAVQAARDHLSPGGTFAMYNYYQPFLLDRYATMLRQVFGARPCVQLGNPLGGRRQAVLTERLGGAVPNCATPWHGRARLAATDNWPFPYLPTPSIPTLFLWVAGLVLVASIVAVRVALWAVRRSTRSGGSFRSMAPFADLFCMGAAFMLLESKNIVQFALLFGTTWYVNSLVFAGVLVSISLAIEVARHVRLPSPAILYGLLVVALAVAWAVPEDSLLTLAAVPRFAAGTALAFAPVFLANLVFAQRFEATGAMTVAFGANLLGAMVGGVLEYLSLVTGFRFLLVVVAALYGLAFLAGRRALAGMRHRAPAPALGNGSAPSAGD